MSKDNIKVQGKLVRIVPVETETDPKDKSGEKILMQRQWQADKFGRFFPTSLSAEQIKKILAKTRVKMENLSLKEETDFIVYKYKGRPQINLNKKDGLFYTPYSEIEVYGLVAVQHQAHIVIEILKTHGTSTAVMGTPVHPTSVRQVLGKLKTYK